MYLNYVIFINYNLQIKQKMKIIDFNFLLVILFFNILCVLNSNKNKILSNKKDCLDFNANNTHIYIEKVIENSGNLNQLNTTFLLFFSSKIILIVKLDNNHFFDKFQGILNPLNEILIETLNISFFCENYISKKKYITFFSNRNNTKNILNYLVIKNGSLIKNETLTNISNDILANMILKFYSKDYLEMKFRCNLFK